MKFLAAIVAFMVALPATAQTPIPRMPGGKPNLNGLWQAMTTAYWDLEDHSAQPGPVLQLGAIGAIPAGGGVVRNRSRISVPPDGRPSAATSPP